VRTWERPRWHAGDRFVYKKGAADLYAYRVEKGEEGGWRLVEEKSSLATLLTGDLAERGQERPGHPPSRAAYKPADVKLHWPLWVGKRWGCHLLYERADTEHPLPLMVGYHCDREEEVEVPAGRFRCLRIWRRARVAAPGDYLERVSLLWYAPEAGCFVRRLEGGVLLELQELHRRGE
jgi:hypothetical protein